VEYICGIFISALSADSRFLLIFVLIHYSDSIHATTH